jgi:hypothetical protein
MSSDKKLTIIGRVDRIRLVGHNAKLIPAKVDTGADISSIWASRIKEQDDHLRFVLFDKPSEYYTGEVIELSRADYRLTRIANSFGHKERRYVVKLRIHLAGRSVKASFSLANRSAKIYPVLLGRRLLKDKFLVDVSKGVPLLKAEKARRDKMHVEIDQNEG